MNCPNCKQEMAFFIEGQCCGWKCPKCEISLVTTYTTEIESDDTDYSIIVLAQNQATAAEIKAISSILHCNYIQAREKILKGFSIVAVSAVEAAKIIKVLENFEVSFITKPRFPHEIK